MIHPAFLSGPGPAAGVVRILYLLGGLLCAAPAWPAVGQVERAAGPVTVALPGGAERAVSAGSPVDERAILKTGPGGEAVVRLADGALLVLRPQTQVEVPSYRYRDDDAAAGESLIRLVRGGLRFVTGLIGKASRERVRFDMPTATIGIRGTDFDAVFRDTRADDADAGSYSCVNDGAVYMAGEDGRRVNLDPGQTGFITSADLIAKGLANANRFGLIEAPPGLFQAGTFDGLLDELKREGLRRIEGKVKEKIPGSFGDLVPSFDGLFAKKKKPAKAGTEPCAKPAT